MGTVCEGKPRGKHSRRPPFRERLLPGNGVVRSPFQKAKKVVFDGGNRVGLRVDSNHSSQPQIVDAGTILPAFDPFEGQVWATNAYIDCGKAIVLFHSGRDPWSYVDKTAV